MGRDITITRATITTIHLAIITTGHITTIIGTGTGIIATGIIGKERWRAVKQPGSVPAGQGRGEARP
jgi:hypothetical protein